MRFRNKLKSLLEPVARFTGIEFLTILPLTRTFMVDTAKKTESAFWKSGINMTQTISCQSFVLVLYNSSPRITPVYTTDVCNLSLHESHFNSVFHHELFQKYIAIPICYSVHCYFLYWLIAMDILAPDDCLRNFQPYQKLFE